MKNKNWKLEDDLFTIEYVMKYYKSKDWNDLIEFISKEIGTSKSSVKMRILNYVSILGEKGLDNYADISKEAIELSLKKYNKSQMLLAFQ
tara:strand:+ start:10393 stop:10662 length:270 start_codon:yes stop_codon:yes gene_type:complete